MDGILLQRALYSTESVQPDIVGLQIVTLADGEYGEYTEEEDFVEECGWDQADYDTVRGQFCDGYNLLDIYGDGRGGERSEVKEENSERCNYGLVQMVKDRGDRFDPVVLTYEPADLEVTAELPEAATGWARIEVGDGRIEIYSQRTDYSTAVLVTTPVNEQEAFRFTGVREPRCGVPEGQTVYDCQGYRYSGPMRGHIYYGEDDDRIVEWEVGIVYYTNEECDPNNEAHSCTSTSGGQGVILRHEEGSGDWLAAQRRVDKYNEAYERSGIHIRYVLKPGNVVDGHYHGPTGILSFGKVLNADVGIGLGSTCEGTCGCAYVAETFYENTARWVAGLSVCGWNTDLHEIGHAVGLAHGPETMAMLHRVTSGRDFGHGWAAFCSYYSDIMSYSTNRYTHHNSTLTCGEEYGSWGNSQIQNELDDPAGSREYADAAYHLNRIRYDVSLIHCKDDLCAGAPQSDQIEEPVEGELIQDSINKFEDGHQMRERFMRENPRFLFMKETHQHQSTNRK